MGRLGPSLILMSFCVLTLRAAHEPPKTLNGTEWVLEDLGGSGVLDQAQATLAFGDASKVSGNGSCNRFFGPAQIAESSITLGPLGSTRMSCAEALMNQEAKYLKALQAAERWEWKAPYLLLYSKGMPKPLRFTQKQQPGAHAASAAPVPKIDALSNRIWRFADADSTSAPGSIYIFLSNGTLLQTSCGETYRVAKWKVDKQSPSLLRVTEDGQLAFTAIIKEVTADSLQMQQNLVRSKETRNVRMQAVNQEYVCPDQTK
jgi:heat shock protein HslJ